MRNHEAGPEGGTGLARESGGEGSAAAGRLPRAQARYWVTYQSATFQVGPTEDGLPVKFWTFGFTSQTSSR